MAHRIGKRKIAEMKETFNILRDNKKLIIKGEKRTFKRAEVDVFLKEYPGEDIEVHWGADPKTNELTPIIKTKISPNGIDKGLCC